MFNDFNINSIFRFYVSIISTEIYFEWIFISNNCISRNINSNISFTIFYINFPSITIITYIYFSIKWSSIFSSNINRNYNTFFSYISSNISIIINYNFSSIFFNSNSTISFIWVVFTSTCITKVKEVNSSIISICRNSVIKVTFTIDNSYITVDVPFLIYLNSTIYKISIISFKVTFIRTVLLGKSVALVTVIIVLFCSVTLIEALG